MKPEPPREQAHTPMLELRHVWRTYQAGETTVVALDDVSLTIGAAEMVAIQGPSGSGKSTLLQIVGLLDRPSEGSVLLDGQDLSTLTDAEQTRLRLTTLGFVFQRFHLLNDLTAIENVELPMEAAGVPPQERRARAAELLRAVGLAERLEFRPSRLSGGQRQRVAIARALANNPRIILADEPTGELHSEDKALVLDLFRQFHAEGRAIVMVTHDKEVAAVAERQIEIRDGRVYDRTNEVARPEAEAAGAQRSLQPAGDMATAPNGTAGFSEPFSYGMPPGAALATAQATAAATSAAVLAMSAGLVEPTAVPTAVPPTAMTPMPPSSVRATNGVPVRRRPARRWPKIVLTVALVAGLVAGGAALYSRYGMGAQTPAPVEQAATLKSVARGELRPESEATVRTLVGGVVTQLPVTIGSNVVENQELARVRAPDGSISIVTAPWNGSVTNLPVHAGDTVTAGATIAAVGDVSRLRIETDDVDEFLVARIRVGQPVTVTVDAVEGRELQGRVRSIALRSERDAEGDLHYPVIVDLDWTPPDVRSGMTVRVHIPTT